MSRFFHRDAGAGRFAPGSQNFDDLETAVRAAIAYARRHGDDQEVFEAGSKPYPVKVREIPAGNARALGAWAERGQ